MPVLLFSCENTVGIESIMIEESMLEMAKGETYHLTLQTTPEGYDKNGNVSWISTDEEVVSVSEDGVVSALAPGDAKIVAEAGGKYDFCLVTVKGNAVESLTLNMTSCMLAPGETADLDVTVSPNDADYTKVIWSSSDMNVATVDGEGIVTAVSEGVAYVTAEVGGVDVDCMVVVAGLPDLGDFFYSDGSYSEHLVPEKDVIGVVFWIGDPAEEDPSLKNDFPDCRNGLVVAVKGAGTQSWQQECSDYQGTVGDWISENAPEYMSVTTGVGLDDNLNKKVGYNNTKAIKLFNESNPEFVVNPVEELENFCNKLRAPSNTSGWFFPSAKEVSLLCSGELKGNIFDQSGFTSNRERINERLKMLSDADVLSMGMYWTSSEYNEKESFLMDYNYGVLGCREKGDNVGNVRYILAF